MARLNRLRFPVFPGGGSFRVHALGDRPRGDTPMRGGSLLANGFGHMELSTLQGRVDVSVVLEEWDTAPPDSDGSSWEEHASAQVFLRGYVVVSGGIPGAAVRLRLACGTGPYRARVHARRRHAVAERYDRLLRRYRDPKSEAFRVAEQCLRGQEEFLIRLWPDAARRPSAAEREVRYPTAVSG
ncbi:hypothetical protein ACFO4E_18785 [Nocardiopsis mangrovi]|uniref:Uncharacterized protein n=1 Tax=Nocardiopsis mangrovi TaxID=1179818 RepID=A0ABV9DYC9_9ACTN